MTLAARAITLEIGGRVLVEGLDLSVSPGAVTVVVGPNGAGKSTLLRALCGLLPLEHGQVTLRGTPLSSVAPRARARAIAYLPQQTPAAPGLTVRDAVLLGRLPHRSRLAGPSADDHARVGTSLERVGMAAFTERRLDSLSGGERQRVMLARMLATEADVMVLDEPTAALDVRHALDLLETLRALAREGRAVVLALHDLPLADAFADQVVCLDARGTTRVGPPCKVLSPDTVQAVFGAPFDRDDDGVLRLQLPDGAAVTSG
ncbi:MAG: ABC transporter ATP-binding protein [Nannocystaceae bacterium]|nr:ABC transporter ATP-binding protein [bacterium]